MLCMGCVCVLQEASALEQNVKGKAVSAEAKRAQAVASIRREEAVLAQQANELAGQVCAAASRHKLVVLPCYIGAAVEHSILRTQVWLSGQLCCGLDNLKGASAHYEHGSCG